MIEEFRIHPVWSVETSEASWQEGKVTVVHHPSIEHYITTRWISNESTMIDDGRPSVNVVVERTVSVVPVVEVGKDDLTRLIDNDRCVTSDDAIAPNNEGVVQMYFSSVCAQSCCVPICHATWKEDGGVWNVYPRWHNRRVSGIQVSTIIKDENRSWESVKKILRRSLPLDKRMPWISTVVLLGKETLAPEMKTMSLRVGGLPVLQQKPEVQLPLFVQVQVMLAALADPSRRKLTTVKTSMKSHTYTDRELGKFLCIWPVCSLQRCKPRHP